MRSPALPPCRHRGEELLPGRWLCTSDRLVLRTGLVSADTCRSRCPFVDHEPEGVGGANRPPAIGNDLDPTSLAVRPLTNQDVRAVPCDRTCTQRATKDQPTLVVLNCGAGGLGDGIMSLTTAAGIKADRPDARVILRVGPRAVDFARLWTGPDAVIMHDSDKNGSINLDKPGERQLNPGYHRELSSRGEQPRWERYARNGGASRAVLPPLREPERLRALGADHAGSVLLAPFSAWHNREWSLNHWLELERLLTRGGYQTVVLHSEEARTERFTSPKLIGRPADFVVGTILAGACLVGCDSGLAHVAGLAGQHTIVVCGGQTLGYPIFGLYPRARWLEGELSCKGCGWKPENGYNEKACQPHCPSLQTVTPKRVMQEIDAVVLCDLADGRSLLTPDRLAGLREAAARTNHLRGRVGQVGVYRGGSARLIRRFVAGPEPMRLWDTFGGLPTDDTDGGHHRAGEFACHLAEVRTFLGSDGYEYFPGIFPATAPDDDENYRLVYLDADLYQSTADALDYFLPRMVQGGIIVLDDWDNPGTPGVRKAVEERFSPDRYSNPITWQAWVRF